MDKLIFGFKLGNQSITRYYLLIIILQELINLSMSRQFVILKRNVISIKIVVDRYVPLFPLHF